MPYMIKKQDGKYGVFKQGGDGKPTGNAMGMHPTRAEAMKQMDALYANDPGASKKDMMPMMKVEPDDPRVQYNAYGATGGHGCGDCQWFCAHEASCQLVWDEIVATGKCNLWLGDQPDAMAQEPVPVVIVADETAERKESPAGAIGTVRDWLLGWFTKQEVQVGYGFKVLPGNKWIGFFTNNLEDLTKETFAASSHDLLISWLDKGLVPYPELWWYHIPGTKHGQCTWMGRHKHIMIAAGTFDDTPVAQAFMKAYEKNPQKMSHGFLYPTAAKQHGVYYAYVPYEISPLPLGTEANPITGFLSGGKEMIPESKLTALQDFLKAPGIVEEIMKQADAMSQKADQQGIASKQIEAIPTVDQGARDAIQALTKEVKTAIETAVKDALATVNTELGKQTAAITALQAGEAARNQQVTDLTTWVKAQFQAAPRASQAPGTVVPPTDPAAAHLREKATDPKAADPNDPFATIAAKFMPPAGA